MGRLRLRLFTALLINLIGLWPLVLGQVSDHSKPLQTVEQAEKLMRAQAPAKWFTTHRLACRDDGDITQFEPFIGTGALTGKANFPKCRTLDVSGEPGDIRTSPNGRPAVHFFDGSARGLITTVEATTIHQTWEFVLAMDWVPGSGVLFSAAKTSPARSIYLFSLAANQKFPIGIGLNGLGPTAQQTPDGRLLGVLTVKFNSASNVTFLWNNQYAQTVNLAAALDTGPLPNWSIGDGTSAGFGAGHRTKWWSIAQWDRVTTIDEDAARMRAYQTLYGIFGTADVKPENDANQGNFILRPLNNPNGKVFFLNHGAGQDAQQMCLQTPTYANLAKTLVENGWYVACSTASFNNWGSPQAVNDLNELYSFIKTTYRSQNQLVMGGHSMGSLLSLNAARRGSAALKSDLKGLLHAGNGVVDLAAAYNLNSAWRVNICAQYAIKDCRSTWQSSNDYLAQTDGYNPALQRAIDWLPYHFRFHLSSADSLVARALHPDVLITKLTGQVASLQTLVGNCDHGDAAPCGTPAIRMYQPNDWLAWANLITP